MTLVQRDLEKIDEGRQEGRQEGIQVGRQEANDDTLSAITALLRQGMSAEDIVNKLLKDLAKPAGK